MSLKLDTEYIILGSNLPTCKAFINVISRHYDVTEIPLEIGYNYKGKKEIKKFNLKKINVSNKKNLIITADLIHIIKKFNSLKILQELISKSLDLLNHIIYINSKNSYFLHSNKIYYFKNNRFSVENFFETWNNSSLNIIKVNSISFISNFNVKENLFHFLKLEKTIPLSELKKIDKLLRINIVSDKLLSIIRNLENEPHKFQKNYNFKNYFNPQSLNVTFSRYLSIENKCSVELLYRKLPNETINNISVANIRVNMGKILANLFYDKIKNLDYVIPIPETGKFYAKGFSINSKIPYLEAIIKRKDFERSFNIENIDRRNTFLNKKLELITDLVEGKSIALIDEAIFTGSTLKSVIHLLRNNGVKKIVVFIPSPISKSNCNFDFIPKHELMYNKIDFEYYNKYLESTSLYNLDMDTFKKVMNKYEKSCVKCFETKN